MTPDDVLKVWQLLEHVGIPVLFTIPTVLFLFLYAKREKRDANDVECPPWLNAAKKHIITHMDDQFDVVKKNIEDVRSELRDHQDYSRKRDDRQQRIETALSEIKGYLTYQRSRR